MKQSYFLVLFLLISILGYSQTLEVSGTVSDEDAICKFKSLASLNLGQALPKSATEKHNWDLTISADLGSIDCSPDDVLIRWFKVCCDVRGD